MPAKRELTMRQLRHMLRLAHDGVSAREIGRRLGVARSTIQDNLKRAAAAGLNWPLPEESPTTRWRSGCSRTPASRRAQRRRVEPDWAELARELKRPGVNMMMLWEEYRAAHPEGYGYSRFCDLFRGFERRLTPVMRQHHVAGRQGVRRLFGQADRDRRTPPPARSARRRFSSPCSAPRTSLTRRRPGRRSCRTGPARMCACSVFSAARRGCWFPTI